MILSILICSIEERSEKLKALLDLFQLELKEIGAVEILTEIDNKELSIGLKRQKLLERATGKWIVFFDDDDLPSYNYINLILNAIAHGDAIDCIGIRGIMTTNGSNMKTWCHRLGYKIEGNGVHLHHSGYDYVRPIIHFNPVKRSLALQAGFKDMRFGEDMDYASRLNPLLKKEYFIDEILFHYRYNSSTPHNKKYGIQ
jgi:hypothetical protein